VATPIRTGGPVEMLEEAVHLLRGAPAAAIAAYLTGAVPFLAGLLFFLAEMSRSRSADADSFVEALGVAALFLWMSWWKAVFSGRLRRRLEGSVEPAWTRSRVWGILLVQASAQPLKLWLMPLAAVAILPAAPACAFFRNVTALADGGHQRPGDALRQARRQAWLWQRQNWIALAVFVAFTLVVFLNVAIALALLPQLVRMLTGYESEFARSGVLFALNWTFFAVAVGVTWLCVDPFVQAFYVARCFLGQAMGSGADLKAELRALGRTAALLLAALALAAPGRGAVPSASPPANAGVSSASLDRSIDEVMAGAEYRWRMPRAAPADRPFGSALIGFTERALDYLRRAAHFVEKWINRFLNWLRDLFGSPPPEEPPSGAAPSGLLQISLWLLAALAAGAALALFWRSRRRRTKRLETAPVAPVVDLSDESLAASQLPEEAWLALAEEWIGKRDLRMALRALYLGTLALLGNCSLVVVQSCKSNREYENELRRRSRAIPDIPPLFRENMWSFERTWYGRHEVSDGDLGQFRANFDRIKLLAAAGGGA